LPADFVSRLPLSLSSDTRLRMTNTVVLIQHSDERPDNRVEAHLRARGYDVRRLRPDKGDALPGASEKIAGCVVYGGLYNAYDVELHPFLRDEYAFIRRCLDEDIPLLGICLGAQMIAWHLGAHVGPPEDGMHEFGYYEIKPTGEADGFLDGPLRVVQSHWHGFELPPGAVRLASSETFPNQAFRIGDKVYGVQFHAEVTPDGFRAMQARSGQRYSLPGVQTIEEQSRLMEAHDAAQAEWFNGFLGKLFP
jgi:GMP synthase (glutamine-hydrolysing)